MAPISHNLPREAGHRRRYLRALGAPRSAIRSHRVERGICTPEDLLALEDPHEDYELSCDIDMAGYEWNHSLFYDHHDGPGYHDAYTGHFDGNGHTIYNLTGLPSEQTGHAYVGLLHRIDDGGLLENVHLRDVDLFVPDGGHMSGGLVGELWDGTIRNCSVTGEVGVDSFDAGGIVGVTQIPSVIEQCFFSGTVYNTDEDGATSRNGGIVGANWGATLRECAVANAVIETRESAGHYAGGLVGWHESVDISDCYSLNVAVAGGYATGGLLGSTDASLTIEDSYAVPVELLSNRAVGGFIGEDFGADIDTAYWNTEENTVDDAIDPEYDWDDNEDEIEAMTTDEMVEPTDMDLTFVEAGGPWVEVEGSGAYPYLAFEEDLPP